MRDVPKIVVKRLQGLAAAEAHPEADLLSAFAEQSLAEAERNRVMGHLASCAECREAVALALPDGDELAARGWSFPARDRWLNWPSVRWGFAAAAAGVLASIGILHYQHHHPEQVASLAVPNVARKGSERDSLSPAHAEPRVAEGSEETSGNGQESRRPSGKIARSGSENVLAAKQSADLAISGRNANGLPRTESSVPSPENSFVTAQAAAAVAAPRNESPDLLARNQANQSLAFQRSLNSDVVKAKPALSAQDASGAPAAPAPALSLQTAPALMQHASPRWSITSSGGLQRSFDAGKTWEDVNVDADSAKTSASLAFRAVAALGSEVWAGGTGAILYHSADSGAHWQRVVPSANGAAAGGEIVEIKFSDPENGRLATSTGEVWITSDDGATWRKQ